MEKRICLLKFVYIVLGNIVLLRRDISNLMDSNSHVTIDKISLILTYLTLLCFSSNLVLAYVLHIGIKKKCIKTLGLYQVIYVTLFSLSVTIFGFRNIRNINVHLEHWKPTNVYIFHYLFYWAFTFEVLGFYLIVIKLRGEGGAPPTKQLIGLDILKLLKIQIGISWLSFPHCLYQGWALWHIKELKPTYTTEYYKIGTVIMVSTFCFGFNSILLMLGIKKRSVKYITTYFYLKMLLYAMYTGGGYANERYKNALTNTPSSQWTTLFQLMLRLNFVLELVEVLLYRALLLQNQLRDPGDVEIREGNCDLSFKDADEDTKEFLKKHFIPTRRLEIDKVYIAKGNSGEVHLGHMKNGWLPCRSNRGSRVAVKLLRSNGDSRFRDVLVSEIKSLSIVNGHVNLVKFFGINLNRDYASIVMEYCDLGSLDGYLSKIRTNTDLAESFGNAYMPELNKWAYQIASAMMYFGQKKIVHGDLAARNVLLDCMKNAKVTDFGMSLRLYNYQTYARSSQITFPWKWMAPESLTDLKFSSKSDVWAYGVTLWEVYSIGDIPWSRYSWTSDFVQKLRDGYRLPKPIYASDDIYESVVCRCWHVEEDLRLDFTDVLKYFSNNNYSATLSK